MPLIFAIGVALGFTNNDGVSALAAVVAYGIMVKPWRLLRRWCCIYLLTRLRQNTLLIPACLAVLSPVLSPPTCSTASIASSCQNISASCGQAFVPISLVWPLSSPA